MSRSVVIELEVPDDLARFHLPPGVDARLTWLLDRQDHGIPLSDAERREAEGLVDLAELLALLRLRAERARAGNERRPRPPPPMGRSPRPRALRILRAVAGGPGGHISRRPHRTTR
jgi:hypothetical protein